MKAIAAKVFPMSDQIYPLYKQSVPGKIARNSKVTIPSKFESQSIYYLVWVKGLVSEDGTVFVWIRRCDI